MNLIDGFVKQCLENPQKIALIQGDRQIDYAELLQRATQLAIFFQQQQISNQRIAIALDRGIDACIAIFGILYSGNYYVPLDIKNPAQRLQFIVGDADVAYVLGQGDCPDWLQNSEQWQAIEALFDAAEIHLAVAQVDAEALAAILYTSGSTGQPKGVALSHRAIINFTRWAQQTLAINAQDKIASLAPLHFDLSTFDLFCSLNAGATVNFVPSALTFAPSRLSAWLADNDITTWYTVPSILSFLALKGSLQTTSLPKLNTIIFAGEVFPSAQLITLTSYLPDVDFYNFFGPTETNVCCYWPVDRARLRTDTTIPIGIPACAAELSIDKDKGELLVDSRNNFSGYWQQGKLCPLKDGAYKTGDKVSFNEHGEFCYHGRLTRMLKCSGYCVEPAEIEQVIRNISGVQNCAVIGLKDLSSGQRPAAAIILQSGYQLADIIASIRPALPAYMQPSKYITLQQLPCLDNGKIDYLQIQQAFKKH